MQRLKTPLYSILLINFIGTLGFSIVIPFLVFLVTRFGGNALIYGVVASMYPLFQMIGGPILGKWSDEFGRRPVLLISQIGTLISWIIFFVALLVPVDRLVEIDNPLVGVFFISTPLLILSFARALDGITGGNISVANAYLADITKHKDRSRNYGKLSISAGLGFIVGPALAGVLGGTRYQEKLPVLAAIFVSIAATFLIAYFLPESLKDAKSRGSKIKIGIADIFKLKDIPYMLFLYFVLFLGFNIFYTSFPLHALSGLNWTIGSMGIYFAVLSLVMAIVQGPILSFASKRYTDSVLTILGSLILGTSFVLLVFSTNLFTYLASLFFALGNGLMWPSILSILSKKAPEKYQGAVQGFASSGSSLASIIGLIAGGILYQAFGGKAFFVSAALIYLVFALSFRLLAFEKHR